MLKNTNDFTVNYRRGAMLKTVFLSLFISVLIVGFVWLYSIDPHKTWKRTLILALCPTALFGCLVLFYGALRSMIRKSPAITVNQNGVSHDSAVGDTVHIPWNKIAGFQMREQPIQHGTTMWIDVLPQGASLKPILSIHADQLTQPPSEVLYALKQYRADHAPAMAEAPATGKPPFRFTYRVGVSFGFVLFLLLGIVLVSSSVLK